jgi:diguanylate cyclase (GGDEF)-like protein
VLVVEMRLQGLLPILKIAHADGDSGPWSILLVQKDGRPIFSTAFPEGQEETTLTSNQKLQLFGNPFHLRNFNNGKWIAGLAVPFKELPWGLLMAESYDHAFSGVISMRDRIILTAILFTLLIGLGAFVVAGQIILPLGSLMHGALQVADGDVDVSLDIRKEDELGIVTGIFNEIVVRLGQNQKELEQQAVTDGLTNLANRKQIMKTLNTTLENYRRYGTEFSLLMIDVDHFKMVNDTYGHLVGDSVLAQMALIFNRVLRTLDIAGRYGGEEFLIIMGKTDVRNAMVAAERIRQAVEQYLFVYQDAELHLTISTGVTGIMKKEDTENSLIGRADTALSRAKSGGRNCVVLGVEEESARPARTG